MATLTPFKASLMMAGFAQWGLTVDGLEPEDLPAFEQAACGERPQGIPQGLWDSMFESESGHWFEFMRVHFGTPYGWEHFKARHAQPTKASA